MPIMNYTGMVKIKKAGIFNRLVEIYNKEIKFKFFKIEFAAYICTLFKEFFWNKN